MEGKDIKKLIAIWFGVYLVIGYIVGEFNPFLFEPNVRFIQVTIFGYFVYTYFKSK
jgi:hypothetical protein